MGERLTAAASVVAAVGILGFVCVVNPGTATVYPTCPFLAFTGCYCPGCGSLRALHQITRGHLLAAFGLNPLLMLSLPFIGYFFASRAALALRGRSLKIFFVRPVLIRTLLGAIVAYWVLRNVPVYPFSVLAP